MFQERIPFSSLESQEDIDDRHVDSLVLGRVEGCVNHLPHVITGHNRCTVYRVLKTKIIRDSPCVNPGHQVPYMVRIDRDLVNSFFKVFVFCFP